METSVTFFVFSVESYILRDLISDWGYSERSFLHFIIESTLPIKDYKESNARL